MYRAELAHLTALSCFTDKSSRSQLFFENKGNISGFQKTYANI